MNNKIIIDINENKNNSFVLSLKDIDSLKSIHLNKDNLIDECNQAIDNNDFEYANKLLKLGLRLSSYGDPSIDELKDKVYGYSILNKYKNMKVETISFYIELFNEINMFFSIISTQVNIKFTEELNKLVENVKKIKEEVDLEKIIKEYINNIKNISISLKELRIIKEYINDTKNEIIKKELEKLIKVYEEAINIKIESLKNKPKIETISGMKSLLKGIYDEGFINTEVFVYIILNSRNNKYENYNTLIELMDREYLIYRFNNSIDVEEVKNLLYNDLLREYIEVKGFYKEYIVDKLLEKKVQYSTFQRFKSDILDIINNIHNNKNMEIIPV